MTEAHKQARYCEPCKIKGDHTSLDHSACPKKREIIRERAKIARAKQSEENNANQREMDLIKRVVDYQNTDVWPPLNQQNTKIATIITLALLDEARNPGVFQTKLTQSSQANGIPAVNYKLELNTAKLFYETFTGAARQEFSNSMNIIPASPRMNTQSKTLLRNMQQTTQETSRLTQHVRDTLGGKRGLEHRNEMDTEGDSTDSYNIGRATEKRIKK